MGDQWNPWLVKYSFLNSEIHTVKLFNNLYKTVNRNASNKNIEAWKELVTNNNDLAKYALIEFQQSLETSRVIGHPKDVLRNVPYLRLQDVVVAAETAARNVEWSANEVLRVLSIACKMHVEKARLFTNWSINLPSRNKLKYMGKEELLKYCIHTSTTIGQYIDSVQTAECAIVEQAGRHLGLILPEWKVVSSLALKCNLNKKKNPFDISWINNNIVPVKHAIENIQKHITVFVESLKQFKHLRKLDYSDRPPLKLYNANSISCPLWILSIKSQLGLDEFLTYCRLQHDNEKILKWNIFIRDAINDKDESQIVFWAKKLKALCRAHNIDPYNDPYNVIPYEILHVLTNVVSDEEDYKNDFDVEYYKQFYYYMKDNKYLSETFSDYQLNNPVSSTGFVYTLLNDKTDTIRKQQREEKEPEPEEYKFVYALTDGHLNRGKRTSDLILDYEYEDLEKKIKYIDTNNQDEVENIILSIKHLYKKLIDCKKENNKIKDEVNDLRKQNKELHNTINKYSNQNSALEQKVKKLESYLNQSKKEIEDLKLELKHKSIAVKSGIKAPIRSFREKYKTESFVTYIKLLFNKISDIPVKMGYEYNDINVPLPQEKRVDKVDPIWLNYIKAVINMTEDEFVFLLQIVTNINKVNQSNIDYIISIINQFNNCRAIDINLLQFNLTNIKQSTYVDDYLVLEYIITSALILLIQYFDLLSAFITPEHDKPMAYNVLQYVERYAKTSFRYNKIKSGMEKLYGLYIWAIEYAVILDYIEAVKSKTVTLGSVNKYISDDNKSVDEKSDDEDKNKNVDDDKDKSGADKSKITSSNSQEDDENIPMPQEIIQNNIAFNQFVPEDQFPKLYFTKPIITKLPFKHVPDADYNDIEIIKKALASDMNKAKISANEDIIIDSTIYSESDILEFDTDISTTISVHSFIRSEDDTSDPSSRGSQTPSRGSQTPMPTQSNNSEFTEDESNTSVVQKHTDDVIEVELDLKNDTREIDPFILINRVVPEFESDITDDDELESNADIYMLNMIMNDSKNATIESLHDPIYRKYFIDCILMLSYTLNNVQDENMLSIISRSETVKTGLKKIPHILCKFRLVLNSLVRMLLSLYSFLKENKTCTITPTIYSIIRDISIKTTIIDYINGLEIKIREHVDDSNVLLHNVNHQIGHIYKEWELLFIKLHQCKTIMSQRRDFYDTINNDKIYFRLYSDIGQYAKECNYFKIRAMQSYKPIEQKQYNSYVETPYDYLLHKLAQTAKEEIENLKIETIVFPFFSFPNEPYICYSQTLDMLAYETHADEINRVTLLLQNFTFSQQYNIFDGIKQAIEMLIGNTLIPNKYLNCRSFYNYYCTKAICLELLVKDYIIILFDNANSMLRNNIITTFQSVTDVDTGLKTIKDLLMFPSEGIEIFIKYINVVCGLATYYRQKKPLRNSVTGNEAKVLYELVSNYSILLETYKVNFISCVKQIEQAIPVFMNVINFCLKDPNKSETVQLLSAAWWYVSLSLTYLAIYNVWTTKVRVAVIELAIWAGTKVPFNLTIEDKTYHMFELNRVAKVTAVGVNRYSQATYMCLKDYTIHLFGIDGIKNVDIGISSILKRPNNIYCYDFEKFYDITPLESLYLKIESEKHYMYPINQTVMRWLYCMVGFILGMNCRKTKIYLINSIDIPMSNLFNHFIEIVKVADEADYFFVTKRSESFVNERTLNFAMGSESNGYIDYSTQPFTVHYKKNSSQAFMQAVMYGIIALHCSGNYKFHKRTWIYDNNNINKVLDQNVRIVKTTVPFIKNSFINYKLHQRYALAKSFMYGLSNAVKNFMAYGVYSTLAVYSQSNESNKYFSKKQTEVLTEYAHNYKICMGLKSYLQTGLQIPNESIGEVIEEIEILKNHMFQFLNKISLEETTKIIRSIENSYNNYDFYGANKTPSDQRIQTLKKDTKLFVLELQKIHKYVLCKLPPVFHDYIKIFLTNTKMETIIIAHGPIMHDNLEYAFNLYINEISLMKPTKDAISPVNMITRVNTETGNPVGMFKQPVLNTKIVTMNNQLKQSITMKSFADLFQNYSIPNPIPLGENVKYEDTYDYFKDLSIFNKNEYQPVIGNIYVSLQEELKKLK